MKKLGPAGMKVLKIVHIISVALWFGGIISLAVLTTWSPMSEFERVISTYNSMRIIDSSIIRNGAQGILLSSIIYSIWTNWGFFKQRWVSVKWVTFILQMVLGILFLNNWTAANLAMLETHKSLALTNSDFIRNHSLIQLGTTTQITIIIFKISISVFKPWKKKLLNKTN